MKPTQPKNLVSGVSSRSIRLALQLASFSCVALSAASFADAVTLTTNDPAGKSSLLEADRWSDLAVPSSAKDYTSNGFTVRTPAVAGDVVFAGKSLTLAAGATSRLLGKGGGSNTTQSVTFPNLILDGGRLDQANGFSTTNVLFTVKGAINVVSQSMLGAIGANANASVNFEVMDIVAPISGSGGLTVAGTVINNGDDHGVVRLSAANPYTGEIDINSPTGGTIASATHRLLQLNHPDALRFATLGLLTSTPNGMSFAATANTASFRIGALTGGANQMLSDTAGNPVTLEIGGSGLDSFYGGTFSGNGSLVKAGAGTVTILGQAQTFTGTVTVQQGVLSLDTGALLNNNAKIVIASGAKLDLSHGETDIVAGLTLNGVVKADGVYDSTNSGGQITGSGKIRVNTGAPVADNVKLMANDAVGTSSFNTGINWSDSTAPSALNSYFTLLYTVRTPADSNSYTFAGSSLSLDAGGRLLGKGAGTVGAIQNITVPNLIMNGGRIEQAAAAIAGATMNLDGNISVLQDGSLGALGPGTANATNYETLNVLAKISGASGITLHIAGAANGNANTGTVMLSNENAFAGTVSVEQPGAVSGQTTRLLELNHLSALKNATLALTSTTTNGVSFSSQANTGAFKMAGLSGATNQNLADVTGAAVQLDIGGTNVDSTYDGALDGPGSIAKSGTGTLTMTGLNTYTGNTTVNGGKLSLTQASLADGSTISISSTGVLDLPHGQTDVVNKLVINGVTQAAGVYSAANTAGRITGTGKLQVTTGAAGSGFASYMDQFTGLSAANKAATADPDGDGLSNLLEYALDGLDPTKADRIATITAQGTLSFTKRAAAVANGDVTYSIETSATLDAWTKVTPTVDNATTISYTLPAGQPRAFMRLRVDSAQ